MSNLVQFPRTRTLGAIDPMSALSTVAKLTGGGSGGGGGAAPGGMMPSMTSQPVTQTQVSPQISPVMTQQQDSAGASVSANPSQYAPGGQQAAPSAAAPYGGSSAPSIPGANFPAPAPQNYGQPVYQQASPINWNYLILGGIALTGFLIWNKSKKKGNK